MSAHTLAVPSGRLESLRLRFRVARQRAKLDVALAEGVDPDGDQALVLRAGQLTALSTRRAIASTIQNLLDAADEPPGAFGVDGSRPPLQRKQVLASREGLVALAARLREPGYVPPQAAALAELLVWDSASPLYAAGPEWAVGDIVEMILALT